MQLPRMIEIENEIKDKSESSEVPVRWLRDWLRMVRESSHVNIGENLAYSMDRKCI